MRPRSKDYSPTLKGLPVHLSSITSEVLHSFPETVQVFMHYKLGCVGCPVASYETIGEVARIYKLSARKFLKDLREIIRRKNPNL